MSAVWSEETEESVIGAMLLHSRAVMIAQDQGLRPESFYSGKHRLICKAIFDLEYEGKQHDALSVVELLRQRGSLPDAGGQPKIIGLSQFAGLAGSVAGHAAIIVEHEAVRRLQGAASRIQEIAIGEGGAIDKLSEAGEVMATALEDGTPNELPTVGERMTETMADIETAVKTGKRREGLPTGFKDVDRMTHGMRTDQLIIIAGRPGMGKSTLTNNIAEHLAQKSHTVGIFSLEMGAEEVGLRMACSLGQMDHGKVSIGDLTESEWFKLKRAGDRLAKLPIYIFDGDIISIPAIRASARKLQRKHGLDLVIVDYIQLMVDASESDGRQNQVAAISRGLKMLARELKCPVIALSQLNRGVEARPNKRPNLSDLRDSGAIEQDADIVAFLYRDDYYNAESEAQGEAEFIIAKQRAGETGTSRLAYIAKQYRFSNLGTGVEPPPNELTEVF